MKTDLALGALMLLVAIIFSYLVWGISQSHSEPEIDPETGLAIPNLLGSGFRRQ